MSRQEPIAKPGIDNEIASQSRGYGWQSEGSGNRSSALVWAAMKLSSLVVCGLLAAALQAAPLHAQFVIETSTGLFTPSFRGDANTTWFGWGNGTFFGDPIPPSSTRILNNIAPTLGTVGLAEGVQFFQNDRFDDPFVGIGSSSGNIYKGGAGPFSKPAIDLTMVIPTDGVVGTGFTTIIIQGTSLTSGSFGAAEAFLINQPIFQNIGAVSPFFLMATSDDNRAQFWAEYKLPGNAAEYTVTISFPETINSEPLSIAGMTVDSYWSSTGFAMDTVQAVPEPGSVLLLAVGAGLLALRRRFANRRPGA